MEITSDQFYRAIDSLKADLREDLQAIQGRLDVLNGRTGKSEVEIGRLDSRLKNTERELFRRRNDPEDSGTITTRHKRQTRDGTGEAWAEERITKREKGLIAFGFIVVSVMLKILELVGTKFWDVVTAHKP